MSYDNTNRGILSRNDRKEKAEHPDMKGSVNIDGVEYWVSAWKRDEDAKPNSPVLRFAFKPKDEQRKTPGKQSEEFQAPKPSADFDDAIPFSNHELRGYWV